MPFGPQWVEDNSQAYRAHGSCYEDSYKLPEDQFCVDLGLGDEGVAGASLAVSSHTDSYLAALITSGYQIYSAAQSQRVLDKIPAPLCASQREESGSSTYAYGAAAPSVSEAREVRYV